MDTLKKIKELRELHGYTQEDLALMLNLSGSTYTKIEQGVNKDMSLSLLKQIASALETTVGALVDDVEVVRPKKELQNLKNQVQRLEVDNMYLKFTIFGKDQLITNLQNPPPPPEPPQKTAQQIEFEATKALFDKKWKELVVDVNNKKNLPKF